MENGRNKENNAAREGQAFEPLPSIIRGEDITLRDDLHDFSILLDYVRISRRRGVRFRLIDTGRFDRLQLEWLAEAGADLYTSDEARADSSELEILNKAGKRGKSICAYFHQGVLAEEEESGSISYPALQDLGRDGLYVHLTNRYRERDGRHLDELAYACQRGGSWLVYYHHGPLDLSLEELARNGAWIHATEQIFVETEEKSLFLDKLKSAISAGLRFVLHIEKRLDASLVQDVMSAGTTVLFKTSLFDYRSPFHPLERKARKKKLDFRAFYLYPNILP